MNYNEIVSLALSYADRTDNEVTSRMDDFLRMTESRVNRAFKVRNMSTRAVLSMIEDQVYYGMPADFNGLRDIEIYDSLTPNSKQTLKYLSPEQMNNRVSASNAGVNSAFIYYTIIANQLQITPAQSSGKTMEIVYYQDLRPLGTADPENWVSVYVPDAYVNGLLTEISAFVKDKEAALLWNERFVISLAEISDDDAETRWSGTAMETRVG